ncbi:MAG: hypothetical protein J6Y30_01330 [Treponema sp.]|nr:hypothetical protein [Treponema sp.]
MANQLRGLKQLASPISTSGKGVEFENDIQALFLLTMLVDGELPFLRNNEIESLLFQAKWKEHDTDDLVIFSKQRQTGIEQKLLIQIKLSVTFTESDVQFCETIANAWSDFNNDNFDKENDTILLITGPLSKIDIDNARSLFDDVLAFDSAKDFFDRIALPKLTNNNKRKKLQILKNVLKNVNNSIMPSDSDVFDFMRHFYILVVGMDLYESVEKSLIYTVVKSNFKIDSEIVFSRAKKIAHYFNEKAGILNKNSDFRDYKLLQNELKGNITAPQYIQQTQGYTPSELNINRISLIKFSLLEQWSENSLKDREIITQFFNKDFNFVINELSELKSKSQFVKNQEEYFYISKTAESERIIFATLETSLLEDFEKIAIEVLSEQDPLYNLIKNERLLGKVYRETPRYSKNLRQGIINNLVWLNSNKSNFHFINDETITKALNNIIYSVLHDTDWKVWVSLDRNLEILAELSTETFINELSEMISYKETELSDLLEHGEYRFIYGNFIANILCAMEILSWYTVCLEKIIDILVELCSFDILNNYASNPVKTLINLLLPWAKFVPFTAENKISFVVRIRRADVNTAFKLLMRLLTFETMGFETRKPKYLANISENDSDKASREEWLKCVKGYNEILLEILSSNKNLLSEVMKDFCGLYIETKQDLMQFFQKEKDNPNIYQFWYQLYLQIAKNKQFRNANWAVSDDELKKMEEIEKAIRPTDLYLLHKPLFAEQDYELIDEDVKDWSVELDKIKEKRFSALKQLFDQDGEKAIFKFMKTERMAENVACILSDFDNVDFSYFFPSFLLTENEIEKAFIKKYIWYLSRKGNEIEKINFKTWNETEKINFCLFMQFEQSTWDFVQILLDNPMNYWQEVVVLPLQSNSDLTMVTEKFISVKRYWLAAGCLFAQNYNKKEISEEKLFKVMSLLASKKEQWKYIDPYEIVTLLKIIQNSNLSVDDKASIELKFVSYFIKNDSIRLKYVYEKFVTSPQFFLDIVAEVYRSDDDTKQKRVSKEKEDYIFNMFNILSRWETVPCVLNGKLNSTDFDGWLKNVIDGANKIKRLSTVHVLIGRLLYYAPRDTDGFWIDKHIAGILDKTSNAKMLEGFYGVAITELYKSGKSLVDESKEWVERCQELKRLGFSNFSICAKNISDNYATLS